MTMNLDQTKQVQWENEVYVLTHNVVGKSDKGTANRATKVNMKKSQRRRMKEDKDDRYSEHLSN